MYHVGREWHQMLSNERIEIARDRKAEEEENLLIFMKYVI